jgi:DNA-binding transcriptional LysR family regulator
MTLQQIRYAIAVADSSSMNEAAKQLFISQPSLSGSIKDLETEIGLEIFKRTSKGITVTPEGEEFLSYARQIADQYRLMESRYIEKKVVKKKFSVSTQHYSFAVDAFIKMVGQFGMDEYEFAIHETKTYEVINDVKKHKSELGILYVNDFNRKIMEKLFKENDLVFTEFFKCNVYVYLWKNHPLADKKSISIKELEEYPCLSFDQGENNSFYFAEEVLSTYDYKRIIKGNDRATLLNLMVGLNGYTLCSGIISEDLNGGDYRAIPLLEKEEMSIGYIRRNDLSLSILAQKYLEEVLTIKKSLKL